MIQAASSLGCESRCDLLGQCLTLGVLHDEEVTALLLSDFLDRRDVGVVERGEQPRLVSKRARRSLSSANSRGRILITTSRRGSVSVAW